DRDYLPPDARIFSPAVEPSEPYFPKVLPITAAAFAASLLIMVIATLLAELFSGRAMRPAPRAIEPIHQVAMPVVPAEPDRDAQKREKAGNVREIVRRQRGLDAEGAPGDALAETEARLGIEAAAEKLVKRGNARAIF